MSITNPMLQTLVERWWAPLIHGLVAVLFGVLIGVAPGPGLFAIIALKPEPVGSH